MDDKSLQELIELMFLKHEEKYHNVTSLILTEKLATIQRMKELKEISKPSYGKKRMVEWEEEMKKINEEIQKTHQQMLDLGYRLTELYEKLSEKEK